MVSNELSSGSELLDSHCSNSYLYYIAYAELYDIKNPSDHIIWFICLLNFYEIYI